MKKIILSLAFVLFLLSPSSRIMAQEIPVDNTAVILQIQLQIIELLQQLIAMIGQSSIVLSNAETIEVPVIPNVPSCVTTGHGSNSPTNCIVISPTVVTGGATTTFTVTASPYYFPSGSGNTGLEAGINGTEIGYSRQGSYPGATLDLSQDHSTLIYSVFIPAVSDGSDQAIFPIALDNQLVDSQGNWIPGSAMGSPRYITVTK